MRLHRSVGLALTAGLVLFGCSDDDSGSPATSQATVAPTSDGGEADEDVPEWASVEPILQLCAAASSRDGATFVASMSEDAVAYDHTTGTSYDGRDAIAAWMDEFEGFRIHDQTECAEDGVAGQWWSAVTYAASSETEPGGTEGFAVVRVWDGMIDRFHVVYEPTDGEPSVAEDVSDEELEAFVAWCEAWGTEDAENVLPLAAEDIQLRVAQSPLLRGTFPPTFVGEEGIRTGVFLFQEDPEDTAECPDEIVSDAGWLIGAVRFFDTDDPVYTGASWGGIYALRLDDEGLVEENLVFANAMSPDGVPYEVVQDTTTGEVTILGESPYEE